jgi:Trypsin-co-occurring domain 2
MAAVPLADAITNLRHELQRAIGDGEGERLRFELDAVVLELDVALDTAGDAGTGQWTVMSVGDVEVRRPGSAHRLTLTLTPRLVGAPGQKVSVADQVTAPPPAVARGD